MVRRSQRREFRPYDAQTLRTKVEELRRYTVELRCEIIIGSPMYVCLEALGDILALTGRVATGDADMIAYGRYTEGITAARFDPPQKPEPDPLAGR